MARGVKKDNPACGCTCSRCKIQVRSIPDTIHRNCGGPPDETQLASAPRAPNERIPSANRGIWRRG